MNSQREETVDLEPGGGFDLEAPLSLRPNLDCILANFLAVKWIQRLNEPKVFKAMRANNATDSCFFNWMQIASPGLRIAGSVQLFVTRHFNAPYSEEPGRRGRH